MKRYINILMVALATMMTSCLTEDPRDQLYEEDIYNNANNIYINAVAVLYNYIGGSADSEGLQGTCRGIYDYCRRLPSCCQMSVVIRWVTTMVV